MVKVMIKEFIQYNVDNLIKLDMKEFFNHIHDNYYKDIDITFMNYFLELCDHENEFYVEHDKLKEYGVMTNIDRSNDINKRLQSLNLKKDIDYSLLRNVSQQSKSSRGIKYTNKYMITPEAFKLALIRSKNEQKYSEYYLLLEKILKYYLDYQSIYKDKLLSMKDDKIDHLNQKIDKLVNQNDKLSDDVSKLLVYGKNADIKLDTAITKIDDMKNHISELYRVIRRMYSFMKINRNNIVHTKNIKLVKCSNSELENRNWTEVHMIYCELKNIKSSLIGKINNDERSLTFNDFTLLKSLKPSTDSIFGVQNIPTILNNYFRRHYPNVALNDIYQYTNIKRRKLYINNIYLDEVINILEENITCNLSDLCKDLNLGNDISNLEVETAYELAYRNLVQIIYNRLKTGQRVTQIEINNLIAHFAENNVTMTL